MSAATDQRGAGHGLDAGQADRDREAVEVDVGIVQAEPRPAVLEHAEHETAPALGMERAVEEGAAFERLAAGRRGRDVLEDDRQRIVPGGGADCLADRIGVLGLGRLEGDGGPAGIWRGVVGLNLRLGLAEKMLRQELDTPSGRRFAVRGARPGRDGAAAPREAEHPHAGGVLSRHQVLVPAVLAERQQDARVDDAGAVVGHGDGERAGIGRAGEGNAHPRGAGTTCVLQDLCKRIGQGGGERPRDAPDGAFVNAGADGRGVVHVRSP